MKKILTYIKYKYSLTFNIKEVKKITSSNNNKVYDLGNIILKVSDKTYNLKNEFEILKLINGIVDSPKVIFYDNLENNYILGIQKLNGKTLDNYWSNYSNIQKEKILEKITINLKKIHLFKNDKYIDYIGGIKIEKNNYFNILSLKLNNIKEKAFKNKYINLNELYNLLNIFEINKDIFNSEKSCLIHNDLWYKNILGDKKGFISIIDFEASIYAPKQVELFKIYNHLFFAKNYYDNNPKKYKELHFLNFFINFLEHNYKDLFIFDKKQKILFDIVTYFNMLSNFEEIWYDHNEVEKFRKLINKEIIDFSST